MKLVIDIPEDMYNDANILIVKDLPELKKIIANGTPLPKGYGRLIDADALNFNADYNEPLISKLDFDQAPTIIEADKETHYENY